MEGILQPRGSLLLISFYAAFSEHPALPHRRASCMATGLVGSCLYDSGITPSYWLIFFFFFAFCQVIASV